MNEVGHLGHPATMTEGMERPGWLLVLIGQLYTTGPLALEELVFRLLLIDVSLLEQKRYIPVTWEQAPELNGLNSWVQGMWWMQLPLLLGWKQDLQCLLVHSILGPRCSLGIL